MPKIMICGRGGSGKSTLVTLLARALAERGKVLVVDTDESNLGLHKMLGLSTPAMTLMGCLGGKPAVREKLLASLQKKGDENTGFFADGLSLASLPPECTGGEWPLRFLRIGKIERSMEGCACPMGAVARSFLKQLRVGQDEWVLVDTEAGVEHFGRGVVEGVDLVVMVVDPSHEAVLLAERARALTAGVGKEFVAVLNKVDAETESFLRRELSAKGIPVRGAFGFAPEITKANLVGNPLPAGNYREQVKELLASLSF
ncbi:CO dehydrogenase maturation factor [Desulfofundulus australicus DSM 11792]|uniref:CO dehydrogenase maturation factor n=1 Tax=Desulfofundulus australicus DSM 11792 TaxID=1121425 RepID=A0A1M4SMX7_9FIRM|nr:nitrogenase reductase [Desulfofundulus australicus]SHE33551.1 CO dehydrogenase maturation factor [Desulfofundulus australicus DSM 11792]